MNGRGVAWLNIAGLVDFVDAVGTGVLTSGSSVGLFAGAATHASMSALPLSLVPTFAVPLWIIFHLVSLLQLRREQIARRAGSHAVSGSWSASSRGRGATINSSGG